MAFFEVDKVASSHPYRGGALSDPSPVASDVESDGESSVDQPSSLDGRTHTKHTATSSQPATQQHQQPSPATPPPASPATGFTSPWDVPPFKPSYSGHPPHPSGWDMAKLPAPSTPSNPLPLQLISNALSIGPTLLPPQLASLISALSLATKISLRASAFFIEVILESCRYGTTVGLGLTRRALISAVGSARTFYVVREGLDWAGGKVQGMTGR